MRASLVVPCYDEAEALPAFADLLPALEVDEILFVDDGSRDATGAVLSALAAADPRVRVLVHPRNRGVGAAMRTGLAAARGEVVVVYDADRTYPPEDLARLLGAVRAGADAATASPWAEGGSSPGVPAPRRLLSRAAAGAYRWVLGPRARGIATFTCAFRAYRRTALASLLPPASGFVSDGFGAAAEILGLLLLAGARVVEMPARLLPRREGQSKMRWRRAVREHLRVLLRLARRRAAGTRTRRPPSGVPSGRPR